MPLDLTELRALLAAIDQTDIAEFSLKSADFELSVRRGVRSAGKLYALDAAPLSSGNGGSAIVPSFPAAEAASPPILDRSSENSIPPSPSIGKNDRRLVDITSPMVGTFYRAPAPDEPPFVEVGDRIQSGQAVCIVEAMKLMNEIEAEVAGEIVEILVANGEPVEYGQAVMRVNPTQNPTQNV